MSRIPKRIGRKITQLPELKRKRTPPKVAIHKGYPQPTYNRISRRGSVTRKARWG